MYWELEKAMKEIKERKKEGVSKKVREWFRKNEIPFLPLPSLGKKIPAVLFRHIATARFEDIQFEQRCREFGLVAINFEFKEDIFIECNPSKMRLIRLYLFDGFGKKGGERLKRIDLIDSNRISEIKGLPISEIEVNGGRKLWEVHHEMRKKIGLNSNIIDLSPWLKQIGRAKDYYKYLMLIFISDAILFESFESPGFPDLEEFKQKVVIPAREFAIRNIGLDPLIVYHPDCQDLLGRLLGEDKILRYYPAEVAQVL
jgi:hypothetical protein